MNMTEEKKNCGCGCNIEPKQIKEKPVKEDKDSKKSK
jgi:hypothetical protein